MSEETKLSEAEIGLLTNLQTEYNNLSTQLGQIETQIVAINQNKKQLVEKLEGVFNEENDLAAKLKEKYGDGNINIQTGVFTPLK